MKSFPAEQCVHRLKLADPIGDVSLGEPFSVATTTAFGRSMTNVHDFEAFMAGSDKNRLGHPCTGPIHVRGADQSGSLAVFVRKLTAVRAAQCLSTSTGLKKGQFEGRQCRVLSDVNSGFVNVGGILVKKKPSIGVMATIDSESRSCGRCSENGGNMDMPQLRAGSIIYLPVNHPEAFLAVGDVHMRQGNGEIPGMGYEADGEMELDVRFVEKISYPVIDNGQEIVVVGWGNEQSAVDNAIDYLSKQPVFSGMSPASIYQMLGGFDLRPGNLSGKVPTFGVVLPKREIIDPRNGQSVFLPPRFLKEDDSEIQRCYDDILRENIVEWENLPILHSGDSREIRAIPGRDNIVISRLNPKFYSHDAGGAVEGQGTAEPRARLNAHLSRLLHKSGVLTSTLATQGEFVLMRKVDAAKNVEVAVKGAFVGSPVHAYPDLSDVETRDGGHISRGDKCDPYVRFDWRWKDGDKIIPEGKVRNFIDVDRASDTAFNAFGILKDYFNTVGLDVDDACFFMSKDGLTICGEVSMDNMGTLKYIGDDESIGCVINTRSKEPSDVLMRYEAICELMKLLS